MNSIENCNRPAGPVMIDGDNLTLETIASVTRRHREVKLHPESLERIKASRAMLEKLVQEERVVYGITTGFGRFSDVVISKENAIQLQKNLIASHAAALGEPFPEEVVRGAMLLRLNALAHGCSGVRPRLVEHLVNLLNKGVIPVVPCQGSLGASGDLAPLAHLALVLTGQGEAYYRGKRISGAEALYRAGLKPLELWEKEGLALINGTQIMTALGSLATYDAINLLKSSLIVASLTLEALQAVPDAFDPLIARVRPHRGHRLVASNLLSLLEGSSLVGSDKDKVQDAYSLRCIPQVHGAAGDALNYVRKIIEIEANSVNDNPLLFVDEGRVLSGGNFHGQPVAQALDFLAMAVAELGNIAERRIERLVNPTLSGLPPFLIEGGGLNSGFMIAQYTAASLVSENKVLCHPASVDSIPSSANQEDHVSMGTTAARKARRVVENVGRILGIELLVAGQAVDFKGDTILGRGTAPAYRLLREKVPFIKEDCILYPLIEAAVALITGNHLVDEIEPIVPLNF
ncbi:MAG: histidine ammonia-lyase [Firmicutes bacterium]|nr:histidine ammonia-lyase [Bacillota bacterium]